MTTFVSGGSYQTEYLCVWHGGSRLFPVFTTVIRVSVIFQGKRMAIIKIFIIKIFIKNNLWT